MSEESGAELGGQRGREHAIAPLRRAIDSGARLIRVSGRRGVGVSTLLDHVLEQVPDKRVVYATEHRQQTPPFGVFGEVARQLAALIGDDAAPGVRAAAACAAPIFEALAPHGDGSEGAGRAAAFDGLVSLIEELSIDVLCLDELQWLGRDGQLLLDHLLDAEPEGLTVIVAGNEPPKIAHRRNLSVALRPLGVETLIAIAGEAAGPDLTPDIELLAELDYDGLPLLAALYGRALAKGIEPSLDAIVRHAAELAPELLAGALAVDDAVPGDADEPAIAELLALGVLTPTEGGVRIAHPAIATAIGSALAPSAVVEAHDQLADEMLESDGGASEELVRHLLGADRVAEAAAYALEAGAKVEARYACSLAADLYAVASEHGPEVEQPRIALARATALERAGRYGEAATAWDTLASLEPDRAQTYAINAAQALIAGADLSGGARRLDEALAVIGEAPIGASGFSGLLSGFGFSTGRLPGTVRVGARPDPARRARADLDLRMALMVGFYDPASGVRVLRRARKAYAELGALTDVAWCDFLFAAFAENNDSSPNRPRLVDRYRTAAERFCREHDLQSPRLQAVRFFLDGKEAKRQRRWVDATDAFERAIGALDDAGISGVVEHAYALTQIGLTAAMQQDIRGTERAVGRYRGFLRERGDISLATYVNLLRALAQTWRGQIRQARTSVGLARQVLPDDVPMIQRAITELVACLPELYGDNEAAALRMLEGGGFQLAERFGLFELSMGDFYASIAALAEAVAVRAGTVGAEPRRARKHARIAIKCARVAGGDAERALAYLADAEGHADECVLLLQRAQETARESGRPIAMAIAGYQRGLRLGGSAGDALVSGAVERMQKLGASPALLNEDPKYR